MPTVGGTPKRITPLTPSYLHGWSPDRKWLVFTGGRNKEFDIYKIAFDGSGTEVRVTDTPGLDDGPEYSPDGKYIYFNSVRGGATMQIWRMTADGKNPEQITKDDLNNWFAHLTRWPINRVHQLTDECRPLGPSVLRRARSHGVAGLHLSVL